MPVCADDTFTTQRIDTSKQLQVSELRKEISELETELQKCQRQNKGWKVATGFGIAGVAATGAAAIAQGVKLNKLKHPKEESKKDEKNEDPKPEKN